MTNVINERSNRMRRKGLSLIEVLIGLTITLIVLAAMMEMFKWASNEIANGRAAMEMTNQLRSAEVLLRRDLEGLTVDTRPWTQSAMPNGYFEYVEGAAIDRTNGPANAYLGDVDDILSFTTRSEIRPFRGRSSEIGLLDSFAAEVIWFAAWFDRDTQQLQTTPGPLLDVDYDDSVRLYRRVLLIRPDLGTLLSTGNTDFDSTNSNDVARFLSLNDISARWVDTDADGVRDTVIANSLADLAHRGNRSFRNSLVFPHSIDRPSLAAARMAGFVQAADIEPTESGDDLLFTNACAFDVRVYSPNSEIEIDGPLIAEPSDPGMNISGGGAIVPFGAFVDLGHSFDQGKNGLPNPPGPPNPSPVGWFGGNPNPRCGYTWVVGGDRFYDTWSPNYEFDGLDQDGDGLIDEGANGVDDNNANGIDDNAERETLPPYPNPIRGIQVKLRMVEKTTGQVRQTTVIHSCMPE